jgi:hypothetical protein
MVELGTHLATERAGLVTLHLRASAPEFYPNTGDKGIGTRKEEDEEVRQPV